MKKNDICIATYENKYSMNSELLVKLHDLKTRLDQIIDLVTHAKLAHDPNDADNDDAYMPAPQAWVDAHDDGGCGGDCDIETLISVNEKMNGVPFSEKQKRLIREEFEDFGHDEDHTYILLHLLETNLSSEWLSMSSQKQIKKLDEDIFLYQMEVP